MIESIARNYTFLYFFTNKILICNIYPNESLLLNITHFKI